MLKPNTLLKYSAGMKHCIAALAVLALALPGSAQSAHAESEKHGHEVGTAPERTLGETLKDIWTRDKLTGDWWGLRTDLADHGIGIDLRLSQFYQGVASGGVDTNSEYGGLMDYVLNVDGHKLGLWEGIYFNLHAQTRFGKDILADAGEFVLPNTPLLYPLPGDFEGTDITGLTAAQVLFDGRVTTLFGKLNVIDLVNGFFPQVASGQEGFWNVNSLVTALPWFRWVTLSMWGGGAWTSNKDGQIQGGLLALGQENVTTTWEFSDSFKDGVGLFGFYRFFYDLGDKPGYVMVGAGGSTKKFKSTDKSDFLRVPGAGLVDTEEKRPWDVAAYVYQVFWQAAGDPKRHAHVFIGGTVADNNPSFSNGNFFTAIEAFGPMASRPHDRMGISGYWNRLSGNFVNTVNTLPTVNLRQNLYGFEMYYNIAINPWLHLSPDIQVAQNENENDNLAVILGVRLVIDF